MSVCFSFLLCLVLFLTLVFVFLPLISPTQVYKLWHSPPFPPPIQGYKLSLPSSHTWVHAFSHAFSPFFTPHLSYTPSWWMLAKNQKHVFEVFQTEGSEGIPGTAETLFASVGFLLLAPLVLSLKKQNKTKKTLVFRLGIITVNM